MTSTPGYRTPSFWLTLLITSIAALFASGAGPESGIVFQGLSAVVAALTATGYASLRAFEKGHTGKPAYRQTEFWLSVAAVVVGALLASGAFPTDGAALKVIGMVASLLAAAGYTTRHNLPPVAK